MIAQLKCLASQTLMTPSTWFSELLESDDIPMYFEPNETDPFDVLRCSYNPDDILSAVGTLISKRREHSTEAAKWFRIVLNTLDDIRWVELVSMRDDVTCDCVRLFTLLDEQPDEIILDAIAPIIVSNTTASDMIANIWLDRKWALSMNIIFIIQSSPIAWKYLLPLHSPIETKNTSRYIIQQINSLKDNESQEQFYALITSNGSCLAYLMELDTKYAEGIVSTFMTVNGFNIWDYILSNTASEPLIEYALNHFWLMNSEFNTRNELHNWIVPRLGANMISHKYITRYDILEGRVNSLFYTIPVSLPLIKSLIELDIDDPNRYVDDKIIEGLISLAMVQDEEVALSALDVIENGLQFDELTQSHWTALADSPYGLEYVKRKLVSLQKETLLVTVLHNARVLPFIAELYDDDDDDDDERESYVTIFNLTVSTVQNLEYDQRLCQDIINHAHDIEHHDWNIMVQSRFGVDLAIESLMYVIEKGSLPFLLKSPFLTSDDIVKLSKTTDILEYCTDEEYMALLEREDVYEPDLKAIANLKYALCQEVLQSWFEPARLVRVASSLQLDIQTYLQIVA